MTGDANAAARPINYGMFIMPYHPSSKPLAQCFDEDVELVIRAEELGFDEFWIGEHHTMKFEPIVVPEVFIGRVLGVTERIRLGAAPVCLNLHHPAYVATRLAFLDHLSKGRLNLCFGPNSVSTDMELYGQHPKDGGAMTMEALDVILDLWASDPPYHHDGKFWQFSLEENVDEAIVTNQCQHRLLVAECVPGDYPRGRVWYLRHHEIRVRCQRRICDQCEAIPAGSGGSDDPGLAVRCGL